MWDYRPNILDPLVARLVGPGKRFELEEVEVAGYRQQVFKGAPYNLAGLYRDAARLGHAELLTRAASLSAVLKQRYGVGRGDVVAIAMANSVEFIIALIAVTAAGGVAALVNSRGVAEEMLRAIGAANCALVIADAERAAIIAAHDPDPAWPRIVSGSPGSPLRAQDMAFEAAAANADATLQAEEMNPEDGAIVLFTSGTTGFPKGALLSQRAVAHAVALSSFMGALQDLRYEEENGVTLTEDQRSMTSPAVILSPMFHLSGIMPVFRALSVGATIHIMRKWNADVACDMVEQSGMSRLSFVPAMLWDLFRSPRATPELLSRIRSMANGGAPLNPDILAEIRARTPHVLISNAYGQSENAAWATAISGRPYLDHPESCGWAVPTVRVAIRREDGGEADVGEPGEIWTSSAGTMIGYVGDPDASAAALRDGWLATGDVGYVDAEGLFHIVDRKKNMVISGGENIYCAEVERVLSLHPAVLECVTYGIPDARLGERMVAEIYADPAAGLEAEAVKAHCRAHLAIYKVPREVIFRDSPLPRTASGKIERRRAERG